MSHTPITDESATEKTETQPKIEEASEVVGNNKSEIENNDFDLIVKFWNLVNGSKPKTYEKIISPFKFWNWSRRQDQLDLIWARDILHFREEALIKAFEGFNLLRQKHADLILNQNQIFALASTDVFVEKAQRVLTRRARFLYVAGTISTTLIFIILGAVICLLYLHIQDLPPEIVNSTQALIYKIFQSISVSAFVIIALKWLLNLSRAFFHEASSLLERRHALRFGRLYVYLKNGRVDEKQLMEMFQWNKETSSSFLDINPNMVAETWINKFFETIGKLPPEIVKALGESRNK